MSNKVIRLLTLSVAVLVIVIWITSLVRRSIPYNDSDELFSTTISVDSLWTLGPAVMIYDKGSEKSFWVKSYSSFDPPKLDTLKSRTVHIRYVKFLGGPVENRIVWMKVDTVLILDQMIDRD